MKPSREPDDRIRAALRLKRNLGERLREGISRLEQAAAAVEAFDLWMEEEGNRFAAGERAARRLAAIAAAVERLRVRGDLEDLDRTIIIIQTETRELYHELRAGTVGRDGDDDD